MLEPGTTIQRYVVEALIGTGGMGSVYRARDTQLDRPVALKVLAASPNGAGSDADREARERLVREARAVAALSHPNAVTIYDAGDSDYGPFIVMELVEGETLRQAITRGAPVADVVSWMKMAALALGEAHERGIVHRDVKPENLMLRRDGIAKVLDFGIARAAKNAVNPTGVTEASLPTLTATGIQIGTPQYMAPEQIKGKKLDGRADQFSWGVTAYEALTGRLPWETDAGALGVVAAILEETPPEVATVRPEVSPDVSRAIARAMSKRVDDRFPTMRDLVRAMDGLEPVAEALPAPAASTSAPPGAAVPSATAAATRLPDVRFGEGTVKAVIGRALEQSDAPGYSRTELRAAANEIGISDAALAEATAAVQAQKQSAAESAAGEALIARIKSQRRRAFVNHLIAFVGVNLIIMIAPLAKGAHDKLWAFAIPAIAWGIGLAIHALQAFSNDVEPREIKRQLRREQRTQSRDAGRREALAWRETRRERRERMKRHAIEIGGAVEESVESFLAAAARELRPVPVAKNAAPNAAAAARVRVADPNGDDRARAQREAEAEAEAEADAVRREVSARR